MNTLSKYLCTSFSALILTVAIATGCGGEEVDPVQAALVAYEPVIEPVLHEQEAISKLFVAITLDKVAPSAAVNTIKSQAVPQSEALLAKIQAIQVNEPTVQALHQEFIEAATLRVEGYKLMVKGFEQKKLDDFNQGKQKLTDSKIREENYVGRLDALAKQYSVKIDFFPPASGPAPNAP